MKIIDHILRFTDTSVHCGLLFQHLAEIIARLISVLELVVITAV